jgi:hypothetical protein
MQESLGVEVVKLRADLQGLKDGLRQGREELSTFRSQAEEFAGGVKNALGFVGLGLGIYALVNGIKSAFRSAIQGIDDYKIRLIGIAAQMTNLAVDQTNLQTTFTNSLSYAQQMYRAIAVEQSRHYAGANEMMQVYNRLVQAGYNVRLDEVRALGILTDRVMYATQGQGVERQLNTEILALMEGQARAGSMLALELKQRLGPEWAKLVQQHKQAGDLLQWLTSLWPGLNIASKEMENTLGSQETRMRSLLTLLGIDGLGGAYQDIVNWLRQAGDYLVEHQELAGKLQQTWNSIQPLVQAVVGALGEIVLLSLNAYRILQPISNLMMDFGAALLEDVTFIKGIFISVEAGAAAAKQALMDSCGTDVVGAFQAGMAAMKSSLEDWKLTAINASNEARFALMNAQSARTKMHIPIMGGEPTYSEPEISPIIPTLPAMKQPPLPEDKGAKGTHDVLLGQYLSMIKAKRQADIQESQNALNLLKETNKLKKAEYDKDLAAGLIDGRQYYQRLQQLQQAETAQALVLIEKKRQVQIASNQDALDQLAKQNMSAEAKDIAKQKLEAQNRQALAKLDAEVAKTKLDAEIQVTNELKRQVDLKKQYQQKTEDLNLQTAQLMGAITEQEASLQRLYLDWQRAKQEAIKAGAPPEYFTALEQNYQAKRLDLEFGGMGMSITNGFSSIISEIANGSKDVLSSIQYLFRDVFNEALKPGLQQLRNTLVNGFKAVFGESGAGIGYGVLGAVGLLGMMLTRGSSSSWSAAGASAGVTSSEAVRGVIAGPTSIPIGDIGESLADALVPTNGILEEIAENTRGRGGFSGAGGKAPQSIAVQITGADLMAGFKNVLVETIEEYFAKALMTGAG